MKNTVRNRAKPIDDRGTTRHNSVCVSSFFMTPTQRIELVTAAPLSSHCFYCYENEVLCQT